MARQRQHVSCNGTITPNCKRPHYAHGLCQSCYMKERRVAKISHRMGFETRTTRTTIVSVCCGSACREGEVHDFGKQYCVTCLEPCYWKASYKEEKIAYSSRKS